MKSKSYTVVLTEEAGSPYPIKAFQVSDLEKAQEAAEREAAAHPTKLVFIEFFRASDGQSGYINRDGFSLTGTSWTNPELVK